MNVMHMTIYHRYLAQKFLLKNLQLQLLFNERPHTNLPKVQELVRALEMYLEPSRISKIELFSENS